MGGEGARQGSLQNCSINTFGRSTKSNDVFEQ